MPIDYLIDHQRRLIIVRARGTFAIEDMIGYQKKVRSRSDVADYDELLDLSRIEDLVQPPADDLRQAARLSLGSDESHSSTRLAIAAPASVALGFARTFAAHRNLDPRSDIEAHVFHSEEAAWEYLGIRTYDVPLPSSTIRVLLAEDSMRFRTFVRLLLMGSADIQIIGEVSDGFEAVRSVEMLQPDIVLLDVALPGIDGIEAARRMRVVAPATAILFFTHESAVESVRGAIEAGAKGYVLKFRAANDLLPAIEAVLRGQQFVSAGLEARAGLAEQEARDAADQAASTPGDDDRAAPAARETEDRHKVIFCSDGEQILRATVQPVASALRAGNPTIAVVAGSRQDEFHRRLLAEGADVQRAILRGTYVVMDADEMKEPGQWAAAMAKVTDAARADKLMPRLTIVGECAGRLWARGETDEAIRLERLGEELARTKDVEIWCVYEAPRDSEDETALQSICALHTSAQTR